MIRMVGSSDGKREGWFVLVIVKRMVVRMVSMILNLLMMEIDRLVQMRISVWL